MNFNFKEILESFTGHWKFLAFVILVFSSLIGFVVVPLGKSYFESDNHSCSECLDENGKLVNRMMEMSALLRKYSEVENVQERMNQSVSEMVIESAKQEDTIAPPIQVVDQANQKLNKEKELIIEKVKELAESNN